MSSYSIPFLRAQVLAAVQQELDARDANLPLFQFFPREQYDGDEIEIRVRRVEAHRGAFIGADQEAILVRPGLLETIKVGPLFSRHKYRFLNSDVALFRTWTEAQQQSGPATMAVEAKLQRRIVEIQAEVSSYVREAMHAMLAGALQGSWTYDVSGVQRTVNYGLTAIATPGVTWNNAAATIVDDIHAMRSTFRANSHGAEADTVFYHPDVWSTYFLPNTQFRELVREIPGLAQFFTGIRGGGPEPVTERDEFIDPMFRMRWVPISGQFRDLTTGNLTDRWPVNQLVVASLAGPQRVLEHSMIRDNYTPSAAPAWAEIMRDEPWEHSLRYSDNGAANVMLHRRVQPWQVAP